MVRFTVLPPSLFSLTAFCTHACVVIPVSVSRISVYRTHTHTHAPPPPPPPPHMCMQVGWDLPKCLSSFATTLEVLQTAPALTRVATELCLDLVSRLISSHPCCTQPPLCRAARSLIPPLLNIKCCGCSRCGGGKCGLVGERAAGRVLWQCVWTAPPHVSWVANINLTCVCVGIHVL
jgi:hypothetical protein